MRMWEGVRLAFQQIWAQKLKSFFSLVGVIIGITFLIAVITIVEGMNTYVRDDFAGSLFGINTFSVVRRQQIQTGSVDQSERRRTARNRDLTIHDVDVVRAAAPDAKFIAYNVDRSFPEVRYRANSRRNVRVIGASEQYESIQGWKVEEGRGLIALDEQRALRVSVIGAEIASRLFPTTSPIDKQIRVGGQRFRVIGVFERQGGFIGNVRDASILIPWATYEATLSRRRNGIEEIAVKVETEEEIEPTIVAVEGALRTDRALRPAQANDFHIQTSNDLLSAWTSINRILMAAVPGLVSVSLVVGGIVIMNIMLLSVSDRTREIGLRKSLGAKRRDILFQFLTEASALSVVGSLLGIGIGIGLAELVDRFSPLPATVSVPWLILALAMGMGVGITSGIYPAYRASKLDPIEALRSE